MRATIFDNCSGGECDHLVTEVEILIGQFKSAEEREFVRRQLI